MVNSGSNVEAERPAQFRGISPSLCRHATRPVAPGGRGAIGLPDLLRG
jgi:hypothetical protein